MLRSARSRPRSKLSNLTSSSSGQVLCLGIISPRSATLLLALLGCIAHIQQFNYLSNLHETFPHVPKVRSLPTIVNNKNDFALPTFATTTPSAGSGIQDAANIDIKWTSIPADGIANSIESSHSHPIYKSLTHHRISDKNETSKASSREAAIRPTRWFNLLPSRFPQPDGKSSNNSPMSTNVFVEQDWKARQRDQEEDRKSWEAARTLTQIVRLYALICALMCLCGVVGVIRSSLLCTRLFVLSSTLDLILCALSLVSLGIIITYPNIRGLICEELSSTSAVIMELDQPSGSGSKASRGPAMLFGHAASTFWKRSIATATPATAESFPSTYWWDSMLDNMLEYENCDDVLESVLIPLGLVISLIYLAMRIHFLVVIRNFYISLIRSQMSLHLSSQASLPPSKSGERKYSSSSTSSSASTSEFIPCLPMTSRNLRLDAKYINEKMA